MTVPASPAPGAVPVPPFDVPGVARRLASFLYEGVLLFGVVMIAGLVYSIATQQRHALVGQHGMQAFLFIVLGIYFSWFWSRAGQTVAMKAWHIRVVMPDGRPLSQGRAVVRYLLCWIWFLPALVAAFLGGIHSGGEVFGLMVVGVLAYAMLAFLHPRRQFWHDAVCGTLLITWRPPPRPKASTAVAPAQSDA